MFVEFILKCSCPENMKLAYLQASNERPIALSIYCHADLKAVCKFSMMAMQFCPIVFINCDKINYILTVFSRLELLLEYRHMVNVIYGKSPYLGPK